MAKQSPILGCVAGSRRSAVAIGAIRSKGVSVRTVTF